MKGKALLTLFLCLLSCLVSSAKTDFKTGDIAYTILADREGCVEVAVDYSLYSKEEITVPSTVTNEEDGKTYTVVGIGNNAFSNTYGKLKRIHLPETIEYLGSTAFGGASGLTSFELPKGLQRLGSNVFSGCNNIAAFTVAEGNEHFSVSDGVILDKAQTKIFVYPLGKAGDSYTIPDGVTEIGEKAFCKVTKLTSLIAGKSLSVIGNNAFDGCANLTTVDLSAANITSLGASAFTGCKKIGELDFAASSFSVVAQKAFYNNNALTKLTLPATAAEIGSNAFKGLKALTELHMHASAPAKFTNSSETCASFFSNALTTLYVPTGSKSAYEADAAYNGAFKDIVEETVGSEEELSMEFAYCTDKISQGVGNTGKELYFKAAIQIPAEKAKALAGNKVTKVNVGTPSHVGRHAKVFLTYDLNSAPFYTQDITLKANKWSEVELTTPYVIEGKEFYIGYSADTIGAYKKTYLPIAIDDSKTANPLGDWVSTKTSADAPDNWEHLGASNFSNVCIKAELTGTSLPRYDVKLESVSVKKFVKPGEKFAISGTVANVAAKPFRKIAVSYAFAGGVAATKEFEADEEVAQNGEFYFDIPDVSLTEEGDHGLTVEVTAIDGNADETPADNVYTANIKCTSDLFSRKVLIENFTTSSCGNCPRVHGFVESIMKDDPNVICVAQHAGFGTDKFTIKANQTYLWFYNSSSTYAPAVMLDRTNLADYGLSASTPVFNPSSAAVLKALVDVREDAPAFVSVDVNTDYDPATRQLTVNVDGKKSAVTPGDPKLKLTVFLTEDGLVGYQSGSSEGNNYVHDHVLRAVVTDVSGDAISFDADNGYEAKYTATIDEAWIAKNMKVVAFVHEFNTKDPNACPVYNVNDAIVTDKEETGISAATSTSGAVAISTVGNSVHVDGAFDNVAVYNLAGNRIASTGAADITLPQGVYMVKVNAGGSVKTAKVVIK